MYQHNSITITNYVVISNYIVILLTIKLYLRWFIKTDTKPRCILVSRIFWSNLKWLLTFNFTQFRLFPIDFSLFLYNWFFLLPKFFEKKISSFNMTTEWKLCTSKASLDLLWIKSAQLMLKNYMAVCAYDQ